MEIDPCYFRPTEVEHLCGDTRKIRCELGWEPEAHFADIALEMAQVDYEAECRA